MLTQCQIQAATVTLGFLAQCSSYSTRITKIRNANAIEVDFQGVSFSTFISADNYYQGYLHTKNGVLLNELDTFLYSRSSRLTSPPFRNTFHWSTSLKHYFARSWLWSIKETVYW